MTSYLSNILTQTSTYSSSLRRHLLPSSLSDSDDRHITDPEDSHVSRVLRAYYIEKGRPFPLWLGPDPRESQSNPQHNRPALLSSQAPSQQSANPYSGSLRAGSAAGQRGSGSSGLSDLWADGPSSTPPPEAEAGSLRRPGRGSNRAAGPFSRSSAPVAEQQTLTARPLPSQRAGSYQQQQQFARKGADPNPTPPGSSGSMSGSVQERLKARLGRGGKDTPGSTPSPSISGGGNPYERSLSGGSGGYEGRGGVYDDQAGNSYERPGQGKIHSSRADHSDNGIRGPSYGSSGPGGGGGKAYMGSSSLWANGDNGGGYAAPEADYHAPSGYSDSSTRRKPPTGQGRTGLPSGPRPNR